MSSRREEKELLHKLLSPQTPEDLSPAELSRKAHWMWSRDRFEDAAVLFDSAATRSKARVRQSRPERDPTMKYRARAGITFRLAGENDRAWPMLKDALTFDWAGAGIPGDEYLTEWAAVEMLCVLADKKDKEGFAGVFWKAVDRCTELGVRFPRFPAKQIVVLELCDRLGMNRELAHVAEVVQRYGDRAARILAIQLMEPRQGRSRPSA